MIGVKKIICPLPDSKKILHLGIFCTYLNKIYVERKQSGRKAVTVVKLGRGNETIPALNLQSLGPDRGTFESVKALRTLRYTSTYHSLFNNTNDTT